MGHRLPAPARLLSSPPAPSSVLVPAATAIAEFLLIRELLVGLAPIIIVPSLSGLSIRIANLVVLSASPVAVQPALVVTAGMAVRPPLVDI